jgi:hypothetical protein
MQTHALNKDVPLPEQQASMVLAVDLAPGSRAAMPPLLPCACG